VQSPVVVMHWTQPGARREVRKSHPPRLACRRLLRCHIGCNATHKRVSLTTHHARQPRCCRPTPEGAYKAADVESLVLDGTPAPCELRRAR
jgi:hypothetical protein